MRRFSLALISVLGVALVGYVGYRAFAGEGEEQGESTRNETVGQAGNQHNEKAESEGNEQGESEQNEKAENEQNEELARAVRSAKVSLQAGLAAASEAGGKPISAKFEIDEGKFQLSIYVAKDGGFSEVIVDHLTGKVAKSESITGAGDLEDAKSQDKAMATAKRSLFAAVGEVTANNKGFLAVSAVPALEGGHPVAKVTVAKGESWKTTTVKLD